MDDKQLMNEAAHEIIRLRDRIDILNGQLRIVRIFEAALRDLPRPEPMQADIVPELFKRSR
jgi:hypothetical protein